MGLPLLEDVATEASSASSDFASGSSTSIASCVALAAAAAAFASALVAAFASAFAVAFASAFAAACACAFVAGLASFCNLLGVWSLLSRQDGCKQDWWVKKSFSKDQGALASKSQA